MRDSNGLDRTASEVIIPQQDAVALRVDDQGFIYIEQYGMDYTTMNSVRVTLDALPLLYVAMEELCTSLLMADKPSAPAEPLTGATE